MSNLIINHPSPDVRRAAIQLLDALSTWNRTTGRHNIVIIKDSIGCEYRTLDGAPLPDYVLDQDALDSFQALAEDERGHE